MDSGDATDDVVTVNVAVALPAGMLTVDGTLAALGLELVSVTAAPPAGAVAVRVTVPIAFCRPPTALTGARLSCATSNAGAATVSVAEAVRR